MLGRLLPSSLNNATYQGSWLAVWLFVPVLLAKTLMGFNFSGFNPLISVAGILESVDGIPLSSFSTNAAAAVLDSAASWGVALFSLCVFGWFVVLRYRSGLPLAILVFLIEQLGRTGAGLVTSLSDWAANSTAPSLAAIINLSFSGVLMAAFVLSLLRVRAAPTQG